MTGKDRLVFCGDSISTRFGDFTSHRSVNNDEHKAMHTGDYATRRTPLPSDITMENRLPATP